MRRAAIVAVFVAVVGRVTCGCGRSHDWNGARRAPTVDEIVRGAVVEASCSHDDRPMRLLIRSAAGAPADGKLACLANEGGGCRAVERCLGIHVDRPAPDCRRSCDGNVSVACNDRERVTEDCSLDGRVCVAELGCMFPGRPCDERTYVEHCEGDRPTRCLLGHEDWGEGCDDLVCAVDEGKAACVGAGPPCAGPVPLAGGCDGTNLYGCVGGREYRHSCASFGPGATCRREASPDGRTMLTCATANECDLSMPARCEDDALVLCFAGRIHRVSCTELGFSGCDSAGLGSPRCAR